MTALTGSTMSRPKRRTRIWKWFVGTWRPLIMLLFRLRLNWLMDHWLLIVTHIGRRSGKLRRTPLYVHRYDSATREVIVISAFERTDWYRNICTTPAVEIQIGTERYTPDQCILQTEEIAELERHFRHRHPIVARIQCWLMDWPWQCSAEQFLKWASTLRGVVFRPKARPNSIATEI